MSRSVEFTRLTKGAARTRRTAFSVSAGGVKPGCADFALMPGEGSGDNDRISRLRGTWRTYARQRFDIVQAVLDVPVVAHQVVKYDADHRALVFAASRQRAVSCWACMQLQTSTCPHTSPRRSLPSMATGACVLHLVQKAPTASSWSWLSRAANWANDPFVLSG